MYTSTILSSLALLGYAAAATTHTVEVGNGNLTFSPNSTVASVGDTIEFVYYAKNHSVVQSTFKNPCESTTGFFSGYMPVSSGEGNMTFRVMVNDTNPIWFYCSQANHCSKGMVGCVNCPTTGNTLSAYAMMAMNNTKTNPNATHPLAIGGGVFEMNKNASMNSSSTTNSSSSTNSSSTSPAGASGTSAGTSNGTASATPKNSGMALGVSVSTSMLLGVAAVGFFSL